MVPDSLRKLLPYFAAGTVVKGFGRGSKQLGCPTANFPDEVVRRLPPGIDNGVYCGWARVDDGPVYEMVMSVGYNPHFHNKTKTMETHILHAFSSDFYGSQLSVLVTGFIREMTSFDSLASLTEAIASDVRTAKSLLSTPEQTAYRDAFEEFRSKWAATSDGQVPNKSFL